MGKQSKKVNPCRPQIDLSKIYELFFKEQSNSGIHSLLQIACKHLQKLGGGILSNFSSILFIIYMFMRVRSEKPCLGDSMKCYYYCEVKKSRIPDSTSNQNPDSDLTLGHPLAAESNIHYISLCFYRKEVAVKIWWKGKSELYEDAQTFAVIAISCAPKVAVVLPLKAK